MLLHVGFDNYVQFESIKAIDEKFNVGYLSKILFSHKAKGTNKIYDFTNGNPRKTLILLKDNSCVYSALCEKELKKRWNNTNLLDTTDNDNMLYVGNDNFIVISEIKMLSGNTKSKPIVAQIKIAKENNELLDFTCGEKMRSVLFMKDGTIIITPLDERTINKRLEKILLQ